MRAAAVLGGVAARADALGSKKHATCGMSCLLPKASVLFFYRHLRRKLQPHRDFGVLAPDPGKIDRDSRVKTLSIDRNSPKDTAPDRPWLTYQVTGSRFGPFTVPSCGLRVFYKGMVFCGENLRAPHRAQALTAAPSLQDLVTRA
jgi:hypothetical protein